MPREPELGDRREDPDVVTAFADRRHVGGLGEADLPREDLHRRAAEVIRGLGDDAELVPRERDVREDVHEREPDAHRSSVGAAMLGLLRA